MLDELLDLFDRDRKRGSAPKQGGVRGLLSRLGDNNDRYYDDDDRKRRYEDDNDDYRGDRSRPRKKRREFEFFGDD